MTRGFVFSPLYCLFSSLPRYCLYQTSQPIHQRRTEGTEGRRRVKEDGDEHDDDDDDGAKTTLYCVCNATAVKMLHFKVRLINSEFLAQSFSNSFVLNAVKRRSSHTVTASRGALTHE